MPHPMALLRATAHGFRRLRRSRPFWGGLFVVAAGVEILAAPTAQALALPADMLIFAGLAGVSHYLIGALLVVVGMLSWAQPAQHVFHGIVGVLLALASFTTSNFGGFLLGMLIGLIGGSLVFAWSPCPRPARADTDRERRGRRLPPVRARARDRAVRGLRPR